jgi:aminopeptidase N
MTRRAQRLIWSLAICVICATVAQNAVAERSDLSCGPLVVRAAAKTEKDAVKRQYAPDRNADILHIIIDVTPDFKARTVAGQTTIKFAPIAKPLTELRLNAVDLNVSAVTSSAKMAGHTVTEDAIVITFDPAIPPGKETTVTIKYDAEPKQGLYFRTPEMGYKAEDTHLYTQGETHEAPHWYPNYDYPNERSTSEVICQVPQDMTVLSNGRLVSEHVDPNTGMKVVRWLQDKPHVNYLIALAAGKFKKIESSYRNIPLAFYTPTSHIEQAQNSFKDTADMIAFYEAEIGVPYPWDKYFQVVCEDAGGGMENTSLTILGHGTLFTKETENIRSSQGLVAHELVHQWFGDYVTCKDWSHLWLNEGFATYYEDLYDGHKNGRDSMLYGLYQTARWMLTDERHDKPIVYRSYTEAWEQFDYRSYSKGGWVLHMLRTELGEELFRKCIKTYLERHALSSVVTEDLNAVVEELSGRSFDRFFDQWVYHGGYPKLNIRYSWSEKDKLAKVSIEQTYDVNDNVMLFHFPSKLRFVVDGKAVDRDIVVDSKQHDFYFSLAKEPNIVRFDPEFSLLAKTKFEKPTAMLYEQLKNQDDAIGRLLAIEALKEKKDKQTVAKLKDTLNSDGFWAVRKEASTALREIHTQEAFDALAESTDQADARVRLQVVNDIAGFYRPESLESTKRVLKGEKNPAIVAEAITNLGRYHHKDTRRLIIKYLRSVSYRNQLADAAIRAIRMLDDAQYISPLQRVLAEREQQFTSWGFAQALDTLAHVARNEEDKTQVRNLLADYVNHPKQWIQMGAIRALGTLGDPKAITIIETFVVDEPKDRVQRSAKSALEKLQQKKQLVPEEIIQLRDTVDDLKKETEKLKDDLEDIKKRLEAKPEGSETKQGQKKLEAANQI